MTGKEKIVILCSPHNPGGRVWSKKELQQVADFAKRHDLVLISDEIHHDIVYSGLIISQWHLWMKILMTA